MTDPNDTSNANECQEIIHQSSDDDTQIPVTISQTNHNCMLISIQTNAHRRITRGFGRNADRSSAPSMSNRYPFGLGRTLPWPVEYNPGASQEADWFIHPSDQVADIFSASISIYHPDPKETASVQNTSSHDMQMLNTFNTIHREPITNNEHNHFPFDTRAHNNPGSNTGATNEPIGQAITGETTMTTAPMEMEYPHNTEFSVDSFDPHSGNQSDADSKKDENRLIHENAPTLTGGHNLISTNENAMLPMSGATIANTGNTSLSNQTNTIINPPNTTHSSCLERSDDEREIENAVGRTEILPTSDLLIPKMQSPVDSGNESNEDNRT